MSKFNTILLVALLVSSCLCLKVTNTTSWDYTKARNRPLVIAHRGYASLFPENTLEAFRAAIYAGADFFELDVQISKDKQLIVSHDPYLSRQTDVSNRIEFAGRMKTRLLDGLQKNDWWICDFTLAELKTLTIRQNLVQGREEDLDKYFTFPLLSEVFDMLLAFNQKHKGARNYDNRIAGVVIESKERQFYFDYFQLEQGQMIVDLLKKYNLHTMQNSSLSAPVILHSFDSPTVQLWQKITDLPNSQLGRFNTLPFSLNETSQYATTVGLDITPFIDVQSMKSSGIVEQVKNTGLMIHGWTFRDDQLSWGKDNIEQYILACSILNLNGIITEFPEAAMSVAIMVRKQQEKEVSKAEY